MDTDIALSLTPARKVSLFANPRIYALSTIGLSLLSAITSIVAPLLLSPSDFGVFVLFASLFQYAAKFDLGLSDIADHLSTRNDINDAIMNNFHLARFILGIVGITITVIGFVAFSILFNFDKISLSAFLATVSGSLAMIAVGPVAWARASNDVERFSKDALYLQLGMTLPRLLGLLIGGVIGAYATLALWYSFFIILLYRNLTLRLLSFKHIIEMTSQSLPYFLLSSLWLIFLISPRWISAGISPVATFPLLAFAFNISAIIIGTLSTIAQAYYPRFFIFYRNGQKQDCETFIMSQGRRLITFGLCVGLIGIPVLPIVISKFFPSFYLSIPLTLLMGIGLIPLSLSAWFMPIYIALQKNPYKTSCFLYIPLMTSLIFSMAVGNVFFAENGQIFGFIATTYVPLLWLSFYFYSSGLIGRNKLVKAHGVIICVMACLLVETAYVIPELL